MGLETATYISDLNIANPTSSDPKSQGDDHIRDVLKKSIKNSFPNISGAVTVTHTEINSVTGKGNITGQAWTGTHTFPTQTAGDNSTKAATTAYVDQRAFSTVLPTQTSNAGKFLKTDGTNASWAYATPTVSVVSGTTQTAADGNHYVLTNVAATTVTLPASPADGDIIWVTVANSLTTNVIARNGKSINGVAEDMTIDNANATVQLRYVDGTSMWRVL